MQCKRSRSKWKVCSATLVTSDWHQDTIVATEMPRKTTTTAFSRTIIYIILYTPELKVRDTKNTIAMNVISWLLGREYLVWIDGDETIVRLYLRYS